MVDYERLQQLSKDNGISWAHLSERVGMSRYYLNTCRGRNADIPLVKLRTIANALGTTVEYLRGEDEQPNKEMSEVDLVILLDRFRNRPECQLLFSTLKDASAADVRKAVAIIDALKKANE